MTKDSSFVTISHIIFGRYVRTLYSRIGDHVGRISSERWTQTITQGVFFSSSSSCFDDACYYSEKVKQRKAGRQAGRVALETQWTRLSPHIQWENMSWEFAWVEKCDYFFDLLQLVKHKLPRPQHNLCGGVGTQVVSLILLPIYCRMLRRRWQVSDLSNLALNFWFKTCRLHKRIFCYGVRCKYDKSERPSLIFDLLMLRDMEKACTNFH